MINFILCQWILDSIRESNGINSFFNSDQPILSKLIFPAFAHWQRGSNGPMLVFPQENEFRTGLSSNLVPWIDRFADHILPQIDIFYP